MLKDVKLSEEQAALVRERDYYKREYISILIAALYKDRASYVGPETEEGCLNRTKEIEEKLGL